MPWLGTSEARSHRATAGRTLGDGFTGDSFAASRSDDELNECSSDEYALLFPKLLPSYGVFPFELLGHLDSCVAVRAWRLTNWILQYLL